jgi:inner membrane protein
MDYILNNLPESLMIIGFFALIIEVVILGFATFVLFFVGLSLILSGGLMYLGLVPDNWLTALWLNALITFALALSLWKPLKKLQSQTEPKEITNDFADILFVLDADINNENVVTHQYSGIEWKIKSNAPLEKGTQVKVVKKEVGVLWVEAV